MYYYKLSLFFFVMYLCPCVLFAQHQYTFSFDMPEQGHQRGHCIALKVVDMRVDKNYIGNVKTGVLNRVARLVTNQPFTEMLRTYYDSMQKNNPSDEELILALYRWELEDNPEAGEIGSFLFDGDFYRGKNGRYAYIGTADSVYEVADGMDITKRVIGMARTEINELFRSYAVYEPDTAFFYTESGIKDRRKKEKAMYPLYNNTGFKKGIYYTVEQFINNDPVDTPFKKEMYMINGDRKVYPLFYLNAKGKKGKPVKTDTYFATYDGKVWTVNVDGHNRPMKYIEGNFYTEKILRGPVNKITKGMVGGMFGMGGVLIATAIADSGTETTKSSGKRQLTAMVSYSVRFDPRKKDFVRVRRR